jgi:hypothetical protein
MDQDLLQIEESSLNNPQIKMFSEDPCNRATGTASTTYPAIF